MAGEIGYIKVDALTKGKAQEIASKIKSLEKSGAKKILLDLRYTSAGDESEGIAVANLFLNHGTITYLQGQKVPRQAYNADPAKAITTLPVVGAGESRHCRSGRDCGCRDPRKRPRRCGRRKNFRRRLRGKTFDLPDGGALILSVAKYYSPSGKAIQDTAVTPNVVVADRRRKRRPRR